MSKNKLKLKKYLVGAGLATVVVAPVVGISVYYGANLEDEMTVLESENASLTQTVTDLTVDPIDLDAKEVIPFGYYNCKLPADFELPEEVEKISIYAFCNATLQEGFVLPDAVREIGESAFAYATLPEGFTLANTSINRIQNSLFIGCNIPNGFEIPDTVTVVDCYAFKDTTLPSDFCLPKSITNIKEGAFQGAVFTETLDLSGTSLKSVEDSVFYQAQLEGLILPETITHIEDYAFKESTINRNFTLDNLGSLMTIGEGAFKKAVLPNNFNLPDSVVYIGKSAFKEATLPLGFTVPTSCYVENNAFNDVALPEGACWYDDNGKSQGDGGNLKPQAGWVVDLFCNEF